MAAGGQIVIELSVDDRNMTVNIKKAGAVLSGFQTDLKRTADSVKKLEDHQDSLGRKFKDMITTLGMMRFAVMDLNDVFLRLPLAIMKTAGELERTRALLSGLSTQVTKAGRDAESAMNFDFITKMAQRAPFEIKSLSDSFVKLKSGGLDPTNGSLQALVDGVSKFGGTSETMQRASVAIQQMMGKGVISMEELRQQLGEAVPTAMKSMAEGAGVSMAVLTKAVSKGTVESANAINQMLTIMELRSAGAADDMMKTWIGMQAQLKTRLQLAAEDVANAGFGQAMKKTAGEITEAINSIEFKRMTDSFGRGLGEAVTNLTALAKVLIDHTDLIKAAAMAWIAYKVASIAITPALNGILNGVKTVGAEYASQSTKLESFARIERTLAIEKTSALVQQTSEQVASSAAVVAALKAELAAREANRLAMLTDSNLANRMLGSAATPRGEDGRFIKRAVVQEHADNLARMSADNSREMRKIADDIKQAEAAHKAAALSTFEHGNALGGIDKNAQKATGAMAALSTAGKLAGNAFNLLGGWATVLNLAITAGIYLWAKWGDAAKEAGERADRARKGLSDLKDLQASAEAEQSSRKKLEVSNSAMNFAEVNGLEKRDPNAFAKLKANQLKYQNEVDAFETERATHSRNIDKNNAATRVREAVAMNDERVAGIRNDSVKLTSEIDEAYKKEIEAAGKNQTLVAAASKKQSIALNAQARADAESAVKMRQADLDDARSKIKGADAAYATGVAVDAENKLKDAKAALDRIVGTKVGLQLVPNDKTGKIQSKIEAFIENAKRDIAKLDAAMPGLMAGIAKADKVAGALAAFDAMTGKNSKHFHEKDKDGKETGPSAAQIKEGRELEKQRATRQELEEELTLVNGKLTNLLPEYEHAMKVIADPLGTVDEKKEDQFGKILAKLRKHVEDGKELTVEMKSLKEKTLEAQKEAGTIDLSNALKDVAKDNKTVSFEIIEDVRLRTRLQMQFENDLLKTRAANFIENAKLRGVDKASIDKLQEAELKNAELHAEKMRLAVRSPIEKMADDWQQSMHKMEEASVSWSNGFVDVLVKSAKTGKLEFGSLIESILTDIMKIQLQKQLGDPLKEFFTGGIKTIGQIMPGMGTNARAAKDGSESTVGGFDLMGLFKKASSVGADALKALGITTDATSKDMSDLAADGITKAAVAAVEGATTTMTSSSATQTFAMSVSQASMALQTFIATLGAGGAGAKGDALGDFIGSLGPKAAPDMLGDFISTLAFADGGIMTNHGSVPLRKYAAGGIARSPQLALYGEAGPEAYVPLPDGRSIPVTMSGTGGAVATPVTVNVINQSGTAVSAQQGQPRFDGKQMVLDIVLSAANSAGPFRDGLKGAMAR